MFQWETISGWTVMTGVTLSLVSPNGGFLSHNNSIGKNARS